LDNIRKKIRSKLFNRAIRKVMGMSVKNYIKVMDSFE